MRFPTRIADRRYPKSIESQLEQARNDIVTKAVIAGMMR